MKKLTESLYHSLDSFNSEGIDQILDWTSQFPDDYLKGKDVPIDQFLSQITDDWIDLEEGQAVSDIDITVEPILLTHTMTFNGFNEDQINLLIYYLFMEYERLDIGYLDSIIDYSENYKKDHNYVIILNENLVTTYHLVELDKNTRKPLKIMTFEL